MSVDPYTKFVDFTKCSLEDLKSIRIQFEHKISKTGIIHGYGLYFDAIFEGSLAQNKVILSTAPQAQATHWY